MTVEVLFEHRAAADSVQIAGCFTDWQPVSMCRADGGRWTHAAHLPPGRAFSFKFVVDGLWLASDAYSHVDDGHGGHNNTLYVSRPPPSTPKSGTDSVLSAGSPVTAATPTPPDDELLDDDVIEGEGEGGGEAAPVDEDAGEDAGAGSGEGGVEDADSLDGLDDEDESAEYEDAADKDSALEMEVGVDVEDIDRVKALASDVSYAESTDSKKGCVIV